MFIFAQRGGRGADCPEKRVVFRMVVWRSINPKWLASSPGALAYLNIVPAIILDTFFHRKKKIRAKNALTPTPTPGQLND
jgi:hypothetical protein